jgi:SynChlorMet cassette protein ScmD
VIISTGAKPVANPLVVFREEFDDWAVLFDPDTGNAFGVDPVGALIWKHLDGVHTIQDMLVELKKRCDGVPEEAETHVRDFVQSLLDKGLAGLEIPKG